MIQKTGKMLSYFEFTILCLFTFPDFVYLQSLELFVMHLSHSHPFVLNRISSPPVQIFFAVVVPSASCTCK